MELLNVLIELIKAVSHVFTFRKHDTLLHATRLPRGLVEVRLTGSWKRSSRRTTPGDNWTFLNGLLNPFHRRYFHNGSDNRPRFDCFSFVSLLLISQEFINIYSRSHHRPALSRIFSATIWTIIFETLIFSPKFKCFTLCVYTILLSRQD